MSDARSSTRAGSIDKFDISGLVDITPGITKLSYYENVLSNSHTLSVDMLESGAVDSGELPSKGMLNNLPITGGEKCSIKIKDNIGNSLDFVDDKCFYVNRVRNVNPGTQTDTYTLDFCSRETLTNEQCRVVKRYNEKISDNVKKILTEATSGTVGLKTQKKVNCDETLEPYNFIGNYRKPFIVCTWLASKSIPVGAGDKGGACGFLFYETYDGFYFKSIDVLFEQDYKYKYTYTNSGELPKGYNGKILNYSVDRNIDLLSNLAMGTYSNTSLFFDFYANDYQRRNFNVDSSGSAESDGGGSKGKIVSAGTKNFEGVSSEFRSAPTRLMNHVLDIGTLPSGENADEQLKTWKENRDKPTSDPLNTMVQSLMRYNQLFTIKINIMIPGNFDLRAGDLIHCDFPELSAENTGMVDQISGGIYMISSLCHRVTPKDCFTSLTLVRDTFGRKPY